jgi:hypothetical protein
MYVTLHAAHQDAQKFIVWSLTNWLNVVT